MPFAFTDSAAYPYRSGSLFLGLDPDTNAPIGINTERHAITIAGSGSGKGAALLIPNALRWPHNLLVVDPKGEVANEVWKAREALGQQVAVLDPFGAAKAVPARLRATFNPLAGIKPANPLARDEIRVIADGLVKRHKQEDGDWYDGAVRIIGGVLAFVLEKAPPDQRTFAAMRAMLLQPNEALHADAQAMQHCEAFGGLAKDAATAILAAVTSDRGGEKTHLSMARASTLWMDQKLMADAMAASTFELSDLRFGKLSLFLVLPPRYLDEYSTFLRLFVRAAINAMMDDEATTEMDDEATTARPCLFLLDEFYSLGKLDVVAKAAGLMRSYGLHLWPFMQDLGQLRTLYGDDLANTFFSNADAAVFFGNSDRPTLQHVSWMIGNMTAPEVVAAPPEQRAYDAWADKKWFRSEEESREILRADLQNRQNEYQHSMRQEGKPRLTPEQVAALVGKKDGDKVARSALVFAKGGDVLKVRLQPHFETGASSGVASIAAAAPSGAGEASPQAAPVFARRNYLDSWWIFAAPALILAYAFLPKEAVSFALGAIMVAAGIITTRPATTTQFVEVAVVAWFALMAMMALGNIGGQFLGFPHSHPWPIIGALVAATYVLHLWAISARRRWHGIL